MDEHKKQLLNEMVAEAYGEFKDDPMNRTKLMRLADCARIAAGYPQPGTTLRSHRERYQR